MSNYTTARNSIDNNEVMWQAVSTLMHFADEAGAHMKFIEAYESLLNERDQEAEKRGIYNWKLKITAGMVARRILDKQIADYKGMAYTTGRWAHVK